MNNLGSQEYSQVRSLTRYNVKLGIITSLKQRDYSFKKLFLFNPSIIVKRKELPDFIFEAHEEIVRTN